MSPVTLTFLSSMQSELLEAQDSRKRQTDTVLTPATGMWKHARLMAKSRPHYPASLQGMQMCRRAMHEEARIAAIKTPQPIPPMSAKDLTQDSVMMKKGYRNAMQTCKDPALAMQHLLYCMMRQLLVNNTAVQLTHDNMPNITAREPLSGCQHKCCHAVHCYDCQMWCPRHCA